MSNEKNRITLVGNSLSGKSSIIAKYLGNYRRTCVPFTFDIVPSVLTFKDNTSMKVQIVDTRGQERFCSITCCCLKVTKAVIIVYNVRDYKQEKINFWYETSVKLNISVIAIVGFVNESQDLNDDIVVRNNEKAEQFAEEHKLLFKIVSWDTEAEIKELFQEIGELIRFNRKRYKGLIYVTDKKSNNQYDKNKCYK